MNGVQHPTTVVLTGNYSNWDVSDKFSIGNEGSADRPWYGTVYLVAVYDRDLSPEEVTQNYAAGAQASGNQPPVASLTANPIWGEPPLLVDLDAAGSTEPDGIIQY